jgi:enolase
LKKRKKGDFLSKIIKLVAREVLDSRGNPTIQVDVFSEKGMGRATAPSGASTGKYEALELRDGGKRYFGKGVLKAVENVKKIEKEILGIDVQNQEEIDFRIISLDDENKSKLGANTTTAVSLACARCAADEQKIEPYEHIGKGFEKKLPVPMLNVINGGKHAPSGIAIQEFMLYPIGFDKFSEALRASVEIYKELSLIIEKNYGKIYTTVGDEGGFIPPCKKTQEALALLEKATEECGYSKNVKFAIDAAASSFYLSSEDKYQIDGKKLSSEELEEFYVRICKDFDIVSVEDPFEENSFEQFARLKKRIKVQIVGDDLVVTNKKRLIEAIEKDSISCLLLKVNQIGTLTQAIEAHKIAKSHNLGTVVSHRSGETEDSTIADIAVGIGCGQIKCGAPARGERTAKYNRLLQIEELMRG